MAEVNSEQMERLVSALSAHFENNWDQVAPGEAKPEPEALKARSRQFAEWYADKIAKGDKSVYAGNKPFGEYAVKGNGELNAQVAKKLPGHYANFKAAHPVTTPVIAGPAGDVVVQALEEGGANVAIEAGGEDAQRREDAPASMDEPHALLVEPKTPDQLKAEKLAETAVEAEALTSPESVGPEVAPLGTETAPETLSSAAPGGAQDKELDEKAPAADPDAAAQPTAMADPEIVLPLSMRKPEDRPADYELKDFDWSQQRAIYKPFADGPEGLVEKTGDSQIIRGNGSAEKDEVRNTLNNRFFELNYPMMRTLAVYYGGYERDAKFQEGVEKFAEKYGVQVEDLFDPAKESKKYYWGHAKDKDGRSLEQEIYLNAQESLHKIFEEHSTLLGNALSEDPGAGEFKLKLAQAGYVSKRDWGLMGKLGLDKRQVDGDKVFAETGNNQLAYGSIVVFHDVAGSMYYDTGSRVGLHLGKDQKFGAEQAINMSRVYLTARQDPSKAKDGQPQHIKFSVGSGMGKIREGFSRTRGVSGEHARRRDILLLGALHQGHRAGLAPDLYVRSAFGAESKLGELNIKDLNHDAVEEFRQLGINVEKLLEFHNDNVNGVTNKFDIPEIEGEDVAPGFDPTAEAGAAPVEPVAPIAPAGNSATNSPEVTGETLQTSPLTADKDAIAGTEEPALSLSDIGTTPHSELAERLMGKPLPKEEDLSPDQKADLAEFNAATREAQLGARLSELARDPETAKTSDVHLTPLPTDTDSVKKGITAHISALEDVMSDKPLDDTRRAELKTLGEERLESARDRFKALNQDDAAGKIAAVLPASDKDKGAQLKGSDLIILPTADAVVKPAAGAPIVLNKSAAASTPVKRVDLGPAARTI